MTRKKFTSGGRQELVAQFLASDKTQAAFAAEAGVCPRSIRNWLRRYAPSPPTGIAVENTVRRAVNALRHAASSLEASLLASATEHRDVTVITTALMAATSPPESQPNVTPDAGPNTPPAAPAATPRDPHRTTTLKGGRFDFD